MKKRLISILIAILMVMSMLPANVLAEESHPASEWYNFRNSDVNMAVTDAKTPTDPAFTQVKWTAQFGEYVGIPVLVGGDMYVAAGSTADNSYLYKLSTADGAVLDKSPLCMAFSSNNCNVAPIYIQELGLIVIPMTDGVMQAFHIEDLTSAWVYQDKAAVTIEGANSNTNGLGGQIQTPMLYADGKLYAGYYVSTNGNFVCLDAKTGVLQWSYASKGGFYWTGAIAAGEYIVVGSEQGNGHLLMFYKNYAADAAVEPADKIELVDAAGTKLGNQRSAMAYDKSSGKVYFTTAKGYICSASVDVANGKLDAFQYFQEPNCTASTNTPVVYGDRVYYGAGKYGGYYFIAADKNSLETVDKVKLLGNPQGSFLLSTAQADAGSLYFYLTYNAKPGGITVVKAPVSGLAAGSMVSEELYDAKGYEQYCIFSPICDAAGVLYYRNDSKAVFALEAVKAEVPFITTDLNTERVKYAVGAQTEPLTVTASVSKGAGELSYQWQTSTDLNGWTDIPGAVEASYTPSAETAGTSYYRCVVTNTQGENKAFAVSCPAHILVKLLSDKADLNVLVNSSNSYKTGAPIEGKTFSDQPKIVGVENYGSDIVKYIAFGAVEEGTFEPIKENITLYQGLPADTSMPTASTISDSDLYTRRYWRTSGFALPFVAGIDVTAENGAEGTVYLVVDKDGFSSYAIAVEDLESADEKYNNETNTIKFTEVDQTVVLTPKTRTIGSGEEDKTAYTWTSSDLTVAAVDENGTVKCIGGGQATITFTCGQLTASCTVQSEAAKHSTHSYTDGKCTVCGTVEPTAQSITFTLVDPNGKFAIAKDETTELYQTSLTVEDKDADGTITLNDAFIDLHETHSVNGAADFVTETSAYGPFITKLWGVESSSVGYYKNNISAGGLTEALRKNDSITAFFYRDTNGWSDVYTSIDGQKVVGATFENEYTVTGTAGGSTVVPAGATVRVYKDGQRVSGLSAVTDAEGKFHLTFKEAGIYTIEVSGKADYAGQKWDAAANGYVETTFTDAPVVPSRLTVEVKPYAEKTAYISIATKNGEFAVNKNGEEMYRFPVTVTDDPAKPDGEITIMELLVGAHAQYHADGATAVSQASFITKLWGENNGGNASYYFNDVYMNGSGTKTGSNGRPFQDKLLNTVVEDGDHFYIYSFQSTDWTKGDLYTYFNPASESAVAGTEKTMTVYSSGVGSNKLETSLVKVYDSEGKELPELAANVAADGTFAITFPAKGTYTVDVRTNGTNYVTPTRLTVHVTAGSAGAEEEKESVFIKVYDPMGKTFLKKTAFDFENGMTAYSLLVDTGLEVEGSTDHQWGGVYVEAIAGLAEFDYGPASGWMYTVNGEFPEQSASLYALSAGDYVEWVYTRDLGDDVGDDYREEEIAPEKPAFTDVAASDFFYDAVQWAAEQEITNGTSETTFSPYADCTRAQMVTFLWRAAGQPKAEQTMNPFTDVLEEAYYYKALLWAVEKGITNGTSETTFSPDAVCTRSQMVTFLYRYAGQPEIGAEHPFADVTERDFFYAPVAWAAEQEITNGTSETTFSPYANCTRGQMVTFLHRFLAE